MPGSGMVSSSLIALDAELRLQARHAAAWRLRMGQVLEVLTRLQLFFQLGFSSLAAYALERCERSGRWVEGARCVARRLEALPLLRRALATGQLSWSMAELLSGVARAEDEAQWLELAQRLTVRELRRHIRTLRRTKHAAACRAEAAAPAPALEGPESLERVELEPGELVPRAEREPGHMPSAKHEPAAELEAIGDEAIGDMGEQEPCVLTCTVNEEDSWLFEATRTLLEHLGTRGQAAQLEALLAEGQELLLASLPPGALDLDGEVAARQRCHQRRVEARAQAEERCEGELRGVLLQRSPPFISAVSAAAAAGSSSLERRTAQELDAEMCALARAEARQELELARLVLRFHQANGWRRLGYASEAQYARERLGLSRSSLLARRALALRLEALPLMAAALGEGHIGLEAARQLVRIATPRTERAWLERARARTLKHLREEVSAALLAVRVSGDVHCPPPADAELEAHAELRRAVISGRVVDGSMPVAREQASRPLVPPESHARRAWLVLLASLERWLAGGLIGELGAALDDGGTPRGAGAVQTSAGQASGAGRIVLRWRAPREVCLWWHALQAQARSWLKPGVSWLRFLCLAFWQAWRHVLGAPREYGGIYLRDGYCCRSPVCERRDVTPHHLLFRSQGGGDEPENVASVCSWCHLFGIHGGRIRARGTADCIHWELGPINRPCVVVHGRERVAA